MPASKMTPEIERIIIELYTGTHPEYPGKKFGAEAISTILLEKHGITLTRAPVGRHIKKLIENETLVKVPGIEKAATIAQRGPDYGKVPNNYMVVKEITKNNRIQSPGRYPEDKKFKVQLRKDGKSTMVYFNTRAEGELAIAENSYVPVDPKDAKARVAKTRRANLKEVTKGSSAADKTNIKTIEGGIKKLNLYFKNSPELINNSNFGKNVKSMLALRLDKDSGNPYSKLQSDSYYLKKAKQGQLFDLFDVNPVAGKKPGGRFSTNVNVTPNTFNRAFVGSQLTNFFNKGVNEDTVSSLDKMFKDMNVRVDLPNVGKIGAAAGVGFDSKTGRFPTVDKTLQILEAPEKVRNFFIQEATVPNSPICNIVAKRKADGGRIAFANGSNCAIEVAEAFDKNPKGFAQEVNKLPEESGAFNKVKSVASKFLSVAKKGGRFGALAAVGAAGAGLVKQFTSDDPTSYLSDENQQKNMLIDMVTEPVMEETDPGITSSAQLPVLGAVTAAGAIPGGAEYYKDRRGIRPNDKFTGPMKKGVGKIRAAASPISGLLGKGLAATGTPLGMLALEPLYIGSQLAAGDSVGEIATNPLNYLGAAFAGPLTQQATKFTSPAVSSIMRLGISPTMLKTVSRRFGLPGLALSAGVSGYEMYQNKKAGRGLFDDG